MTSYFYWYSSSTWALVSMSVMSWSSADRRRVSVEPTFPFPAIMIFIDTIVSFSKCCNIIPFWNQENNRYFQIISKNRKAHRKSGRLPCLERREVEKRVCTNERKRLTASAAFHDYRIIRDYCGNINDSKTKCVRFFKKTLRFCQFFHNLLTFWQKLSILENRNPEVEYKEEFA